jgi:hypothetical protein
MYFNFKKSLGLFFERYDKELIEMLNIIKSMQKK